MSVKLLTEHRFEFLSLKGGCTGLSQSTLVKIPHCWNSHVTDQMLFIVGRLHGLMSALISQEGAGYSDIFIHT